MQRKTYENPMFGVSIVLAVGLKRRFCFENPPALGVAATPTGL